MAFLFRTMLPRKFYIKAFILKVSIMLHPFLCSPHPHLLLTLALGVPIPQVLHLHLFQVPHVHLFQVPDQIGISGLVILHLRNFSILLILFICLHTLHLVYVLIVVFPKHIYFLLVCPVPLLINLLPLFIQMFGAPFLLRYQVTSIMLFSLMILASLLGCFPFITRVKYFLHFLNSRP